MYNHAKHVCESLIPEIFKEINICPQCQGLAPIGADISL